MSAKDQPSWRWNRRFPVRRSAGSIIVSARLPDEALDPASTSSCPRLSLPVNKHSLRRARSRRRSSEPVETLPGMRPESFPSGSSSVCQVYDVTAINYGGHESRSTPDEQFCASPMARPLLDYLQTGRGLGYSAVMGRVMVFQSVGAGLSAEKNVRVSAQQR